MPSGITSALVSLIGLALLFTPHARVKLKTGRAVTAIFVKVWLPPDAEEETPFRVGDDAAGATAVGFHPVTDEGPLWPGRKSTNEGRRR